MQIARQAILFGSRAKETATPRSDFDIAVTGVADTEGLREALDNIKLHAFQEKAEEIIKCCQ